MGCSQAAGIDGDRGLYSELGRADVGSEARAAAACGDDVGSERASGGIRGESTIPFVPVHAEAHTARPPAYGGGGGIQEDRRRCRRRGTFVRIDDACACRWCRRFFAAAKTLWSVCQCQFKVAFISECTRWSRCCGLFAAVKL